MVEIFIRLYKILVALNFNDFFLNFNVQHQITIWKGNKSLVWGRTLMRALTSDGGFCHFLTDREGFLPTSLSPPTPDIWKP